ncbi:MAG: glycosyltransferase family 1 protein [Patescibacteria group bacterium]|jgi:glycosyltransferase involved in cell wall biosynthesis
MKIIFDGRCLLDAKYSGVSWYAHNLSQRLRSAGNRHNWLLFANSAKPADLSDLGYQTKIFHYPNKLLNLSLGFTGQPQLDKLCGGAEAFFAPNLNFISVSASCRLIVAVHDLSFLVYPEFFTLRQQWWHKLILASGVLNRADAIIADSENTKQDLIDLLAVPAEKIKTVYLGAGEEYRQEIPAEELKAIKEKYNLPDKFLLFVSSLEPRKNLAGVLRGLDKLPESRLVIAGAGGWKNQQELKAIKSNERIKMIGYVPEADKPALYRLARALVYPSFYEGFGLPILEAMASGCPVIAGNNSSQGEVLADCGLLVDPYDLNSIAEAMSELWRDNGLGAEFSSRGRERAKMFNWDKTAEETLKNIVA